MKIVGLVTEYNPFHNGHKYHIDEAKRITGADYVIAVMSGNFVQRGTPAIIDKYSRTQMALKNGIDLVLELPVCYATASAEAFALGAVSILDQLGIVDFLCFGSECGDIALMQRAAKLLINPPEFYEDRLRYYLKEGLTYPAARSKALEQYNKQTLDTTDSDLLTTVLTEPNNILGIEYLKAIEQLSSKIIPVTIQRQTAHYHEKSLTNHQANDIPSDSGTSGKVISSATAIRNAMEGLSDTSELAILQNSVPDNVFEILCDRFHKCYPIKEDDFSNIMIYKLLAESSHSLTDYVDISSDLADRMKNITDINITIPELAKVLKSKNMTLTRINRSLIHILLNIRNDSFHAYLKHGYTTYARVLGIKKESSHLLRKTSKVGRIPVITKVSKAQDQLSPLGMQMLSEDIFATHIYNQAVYHKYGSSLPNEYKHGICILS